MYSPASLPDASALLTAHAPATASEVADTVRQAASAGLAIYPRGGQTKWDLGLPPCRAGILLDTRRLDQVIDYPARDMTITVQAGMTVARLAEILASERQRLPIDVPLADRATIGGLIAANVSGPRRYGYGGVRDYLIGISAVNSEGHEIKAGGRVVKNVAGYDLCKLFVGSLGTLGVITQVTFKLRPVAEEEALFVVASPASDIAAALELLHNSRTRPVSIELLNPEAGRALARRLGQDWADQWTIIVGFEANADALQWQLRQLIGEIGSRWSVRCVLGWCAAPLWRQLVEFEGAAIGDLSFRAAVAASQGAAFCLQIHESLAPIHLAAHAGHGIVVGHCFGESQGLAELKERVESIRALAVGLGGHLVVTRCPATLKTADFVWGPPRGDWELMRAVKERLDPGCLFNPGRFIGGI